MSFEIVPGWCDFDNIYREMVRRAPGDCPSIFVEVGVAFGRSAAAMATFIKDSRKPITFHAADPFDEAALHPDILGHLQAERHARGREIGMEGLARTYLKGLGLAVNLVKAHSAAFAQTFADESVDFVFVDGDHSYHHVLADVRAWWPKIKGRGWLAGHDFGLPDVRRAVIDARKATFLCDGSSWLMWKRRTVPVNYSTRANWEAR